MDEYNGPPCHRCSRRMPHGQWHYKGQVAECDDRKRCDRKVATKHQSAIMVSKKFDDWCKPVTIK